MRIFEVVVVCFAAGCLFKDAVARTTMGEKWNYLDWEPVRTVTGILCLFVAVMIATR